MRPTLKCRIFPGGWFPTMWPQMAATPGSLKVVHNFALFPARMFIPCWWTWSDRKDAVNLTGFTGVVDTLLVDLDVTGCLVSTFTALRLTADC